MLFGWEYLDEVSISRIERGIVEGRVFGGPWHIELQPTNLCNVDCFFCISKGGRHGESLDWNFLKRFLAENSADDLCMLRLTGGGDPLVYPHLAELIEACSELGIRIKNVHTNGTRLATHAKDLTRAKLGSITISLNAASRDSYGAMMRTAPRRFEDVLEGVRAMTAARDALPAGERPKVWLQFVLWQESAGDIRRMYDLGRALNVDTIFIRTIFGEWGHPRIEESRRAMIEEQLREIIAEDARSGEFRLHFELSNELDLQHFTYAEQVRAGTPYSAVFPDFRRRSEPRSEYCHVGWYTTSINARGEVFPCFQYHDMTGKQVGNVHERSLREIWRGENYREFRAQFRELMRQRGHMETSNRFNRFIEKKCVDCRGCQFNYKLADEDFNERVAAATRATFSIPERLRARARNAAIYAAHRLLSRPR